MLNNKIYLEGEVVSELEFSHEMYGEGFYTFYLEVPRLSDAKDMLFITVSERLISGMGVKVGSQLVLEGQLRSYNKFADGAVNNPYIGQLLSEERFLIYFLQSTELIINQITYQP
jgi:hypothetical protein